MPRSTPQLDVIPLHQAINKYFEISLYLLVLMGFGTLASTGSLDLPTILIVGSALTLRGYLLAERRRIVISERWTAPLTLASLLLYPPPYLLLSPRPLPATLQLPPSAVSLRRPSFP